MKKMRKTEWRDTKMVRLFRVLAFALIFLLLFSAVSSLLARKSLIKPWNMSVKVGGFYNEKPHSMDLLFFGSSHMYCSVDPVALEALTGQKGYILATQEQPLWLSYYYMVEALKTQSPQTMVVEVNMITQQEEFAKEGTNYSALDPIPFSKNKVDMVRASVPKGQRRNFLFNIFKYHGRWEELELEDYKQTYKKKTDENHGYVRLEEAHPLVEQPLDVSEMEEVGVPLAKNMDYLKRMADLAEEHHIRLVLLKAPSNPGEKEQKLYNAAWQFARERHIPYGDYNRGIGWIPASQRGTDWKLPMVPLDETTDYYDQHHLNERGVAKFTPIFADFLQKVEEDSTIE